MIDNDAGLHHCRFELEGGKKNTIAPVGAHLCRLSSVHIPVMSLSELVPVPVRLVVRHRAHHLSSSDPGHRRRPRIDPGWDATPTPAATVLDAMPRPRPP